MKNSQLDVETLKGIVPKKYARFVADDLVNELNSLIADVEYGEQFKEEFLTHANILEHNSNWSLEKYKNAFSSTYEQYLLKLDL